MKYRTKLYYFHESFSDNPFLFWFNRYRIDLFEIKIDEDGKETEKEVDWCYVTLSRNIDKNIKKMIRKRLKKSKNGYIGSKDIEVKL